MIKKYKFKYGVICCSLLLMSAVCAWYFGKPEFVELGGAAVIIFSMFSWGKDFQNISFNNNKLHELEASVRNLPKELSISINEDLDSEERDKLLKQVNTIMDELIESDKSLEKNEGDIKTNDLLAHLSFVTNVLNVIQLLGVHTTQDTAKKLAIITTSLSNIIEVEETKNKIRTMFTNLELSLITIGTIFWACGTYIFNGWHDLFLLILG